jgi:LuxR family maltose regulon positive regulatory protein
MAMFMQAAAQLAEGDAAVGIQALEEFAQVSQKSGNLLLAALVLCSLGDHRQKQGRLRQAHTLYQQALDLATDAQGRRLPVASRALIGLGDVAMEWNDFDSAACQLAEAIALAERWSRLNAFNGYLTLAQLRQSQGDLAGAQAAIQTVQTLAREFDVTDLDDVIADMAEARLKIAQGDLAAARRWAERRELYRNDGIGQTNDFNTSRLRKYEYPVVARLWLAEGRNDDVLRLYERALPQIEPMDRASLVIEVEILRALVYQAKDQTEQALSALEHALTLAEPGGYVRIFVDEGELMRLLILDCRLMIERRTLAESHKLVEYMDKLVTAFPGTQPAVLPQSSINNRQHLHRTQVQVSAIINPLSERELEVLRLLPSELSTTEMADRLTVSVNTIRTHLKNLYGKLGAHSRYEAIARAREMELL